MKKTILITGASTGIGRSTAIELARAGYEVLAGVRNEKDAESLRNEGVADLKPLILDVTKSEDIARVALQLKKSLAENGLAALINNAGINYVAPFEFADQAKVRNLMEVNFFGMMNLTRTLFPLLQKYHQQTTDTAKVINIGSIGSKIGLPWEFSYHAAKFAVLGMSQSLRFEWEALGVKVTCVMPGGVKTPIFTKSGDDIRASKAVITGSNKAYYERNVSKMWDAAQQLERFATEPQKVAQAIQRLIESRNPPLRKLVGLDAKIISTLVWLGCENLLKSQFVSR